ncbi:hypothetical protein CLU79DRAFT_73073 [Phycomyces nitens]|nr:hypothetical protein CLU79DRAFT_73073 [Phycomyces nitens]
MAEMPDSVLNGIIISKQTFSQSIKSKDVPNAANCIWLDDSTAVLRVFFTERSSRRDDFHEMVIGSQVTLYGTVKRLESNENILLCSGFNVELDLVSEFSHWIKVIQQSVPQGAVDPLDDKEQRQTPAKSIFSTLSSQVTPTGHPSVDSKTPERGFIDSFSENSVWEGSPTHPIFTSTPLSTKKPQFGSSLNSPIYPQSIDPRISKEDEEEEKFEDDEIYGIDINDFE